MNDDPDFEQNSIDPFDSGESEIDDKTCNSTQILI